MTQHTLDCILLMSWFAKPLETRFFKRRVLLVASNWDELGFLLKRNWVELGSVSVKDLLAISFKSTLSALVKSAAALWPSHTL